jgi:hypothetical protein
MKRILVILVAIICFGISANAQDRIVFRSTQTVCNNNTAHSEKAVFQSNGTFQTTLNGRLQSSGTYTISGSNIILTFSDGGKLTCNASIANGQTLNSIRINSATYTRCN